MPEVLRLRLLIYDFRGEGTGGMEMEWFVLDTVLLGRNNKRSLIFSLMVLWLKHIQ